jgi:hypothetical protein
MTIRDRKPNKVKIRGVAANAVVNTTQSTPEDVTFTQSENGQAVLKNMASTIAQSGNYQPMPGEFPTLNADGTINLDKTIEVLGKRVTPTSEGPIADYADLQKRFLESGNKAALHALMFNRAKVWSVLDKKPLMTARPYMNMWQQKYKKSLRAKINSPADIPKVMKREYQEISRLLRELNTTAYLYQNQSYYGRRIMEKISDRLSAKLSALFEVTGFVPNNKFTATRQVPFNIRDQLDYYNKFYPQWQWQYPVE